MSFDTQDKDLNTELPEATSSSQEDAQTDPAEHTDETKESTEDTEDASFYEHELARVKEENEKLSKDRDNYRMATLVAKGKKKSEEASEDDDQPEVNIDAITEKLRTETRKEFEKLRLDSVKNDIEDALANSSDDPKERELILHYYENKIVKTGFSKRDIQNDFEDAKFMANKKRLLANNKELEMAIARKGTASSASLSSQPITGEAGVPQNMDQATAKFVQGFRSTKFYPKKQVKR